MAPRRPARLGGISRVSEDVGGRSRDVETLMSMMRESLAPYEMRKSALWILPFAGAPRCWKEGSY